MCFVGVRCVVVSLDYMLIFLDKVYENVLKNEGYSEYVQGLPYILWLFNLRN